jgi:hypothetical protein
VRFTGKRLWRYGSVLAAGVALAGATVAKAERLENQTAVFSALDKVTARISRVEVPLNKTIVFGSLKVTPRVCYSRPPTERPKTTSFVEVEEVLLDGTERRLFSGWMFAESPGINAVEHPVFDVWLIDCKGRERTAATATESAAPVGAASDARSRPRRRVRR